LGRILPKAIFFFGSIYSQAKLEIMVTAARQFQAGIHEAIAAGLRLDPACCDIQATARQRQRFQEAARALIQIPASDADPVGHLLTEAHWRQLIPANDQEEIVLAALSQATGVYFFPSREWVLTFCRFIQLLGIRRVLEAGAGRGYLAAALAPLLARLGVDFKAVDNGQGEFESGLCRHPVVENLNALSAVQGFRPDLIFYAWPPPGQSIGPLCRSLSVRYVLLIGEPNGGCTGNPADWQSFYCRSMDFLVHYGLGRSGRRRQAATLFLGAASPHFREKPV
jgi:hypothetical protein